MQYTCLLLKQAEHAHNCSTAAAHHVPAVIFDHIDNICAQIAPLSIADLQPAGACHGRPQLCCHTLHSLLCHHSNAQGSRHHGNAQLPGALTRCQEASKVHDACAGSVIA